jgi:hypothetical protein
MNATIAALEQQLLALQHAMQSGVAFTMDTSQETEPKHLRVGVNSALIGNAAIADLLMQKGIITHEEYLRSLIKWTEADIESYKAKLRSRYPGTDIQLG